MTVIITTRNEIFWMPPSMEYWRKAFLPEWVQRIDYSSRTKWGQLLGKLGGIPFSHMGKSRLKFFLMHATSFKVATGGTSGGVWPDLPVGPPYDFFSTKIVKKRNRYGYERTPDI